MKLYRIKCKEHEKINKEDNNFKVHCYKMGEPKVKKIRLGTKLLIIIGAIILITIYFLKE